MATDLFSLSRRALKPGGRLVTFDGCYVQGQNRIARYLLSRDPGEFVRSEEAYLNIARKVFAQVEHKKYERLLRVPYTHIVLQCIANAGSSGLKPASWSIPNACSEKLFSTAE